MRKALLVAALLLTGPAFASTHADLDACFYWEYYDTETAIAACTRLHAENPRNADYLVNRGWAQLEGGRPREARADFNAALKIVPWAVISRGRAFEDSGQYDEAIAAHSRMLEIFPDDPMLLEERCRVRAKAGKELEAALADCNRALKLSPRSPRSARAFLYLRLGRYAEAIADYNASLEDLPLPYLLFGRGIAKLRSGDIPGGNADIAAAEKERPLVRKEYEEFGLTP